VAGQTLGVAPGASIVPVRVLDCRGSGACSQCYPPRGILHPTPPELYRSTQWYGCGVSSNYMAWCGRSSLALSGGG
jgi:hypothetical protein